MSETTNRMGNYLIQPLKPPQRRELEPPSASGGSPKTPA